MKAKHHRTLTQIFARPAASGIRWSDVSALLLDLGAQITEREGSRVAIFLFEQVKVMHRPHPSPNLDKGAITSLRRWLEENGVHP
ncbi:type II toxin-antitoxin system HicA family toxin [Castellaniella caeni]|uniref:type II toxin-antitoxin system HicA family toxin n=1 Tax=Castellaniella caeni TaxID=266123 RepID=UPI000A04DFEB|nr:type II toxin-antitoxin system HicA family toxin [Castellaniella caeni]